MKHVAPERWWTVPAIALPGGAVAALLPETLPYTTAVAWAARVVIPLTIVLAAASYPRYLAAPAAAVAALIAITVARCARADLAFWRWQPSWVLQELAHPLSLTACFIGLCFAVLVLSVTRDIRRVGIDLPAGACKHCHYHAGRNKVCPECGKPNPHAV